MQCREAVRMDRSMEAVVAMEQRELEVRRSLAHWFGHTYKHDVGTHGAHGLHHRGYKYSLWRV
jgi:hypothetical protein